MTVAVVSCVFGDYDRFVDRWEEAVLALNTVPDEIVVARGDGDPCPWQHPQAFYLQQAVEDASSDWVWIVDIDDEVLPDGLDGIGEVGADVWQMGYQTSGGEVCLPAAMTNQEYLMSPDNGYTGGSAFRRDLFLRVGGFVDVALQDWALWRRFAAAGATFAHSTRAHFRYNRHADARGFSELTNVMRRQHMDEMQAALA